MNLPMTHVESGRIFKLNALYLLGILTCVVWLYWQVQYMEFVWDDWTLFVNTPLLRQVHSWQELWVAVTKPILPGTTYFRPAVLLSFVIQFEIFGNGPGPAHVVNLLLFLINVSLVYVIARRIAESIPAGLEAKKSHVSIAAATVAAFYAFHPAQIEAVAWIAGRFDLLVTTFALLTIFVTIRFNGASKYILAGLFFVLAIFSKEMAVTLPVLSVAVGLLTNDRVFKGGKLALSRAAIFPALPLLFTFALAFLLYLLVKYISLGHLFHVDNSIVDNFSPLEKVAFTGQTLIFYLKMVVWPFTDINPQHPFKLHSMTNAEQYLGVLMVVLTVLAIAACLKARSKLTCLLVLVIASFLPVLNILPLTIGGNIGHERFMAFPLAMVSFALIPVVQKCLVHGGPYLKGLMMVTALWASVALLNIIVTVPLWTNDLTLWAWAYQKNPDNRFIQMNYATACFRYEEYSRVERLIEDVSKKRGVEYAKTFSLIQGALYIKAGKYSQGIETINASLKDAILPHLKIKTNMDDVQVDMRNYPDSEKIAFAYMALSEGYRGLGNFDQAYEATKVVNFYAHNYPPGLLARALALYGKDDWVRGERIFKGALEILHPIGHPTAQSMRKHFLDDLCAAPAASRQVCQHYSKTR